MGLIAFLMVVLKIGTSLPDQILPSLSFTCLFLSAGSTPAYNLCLRKVLPLTLSKALGSILYRKIVRHLSSFILLSDHQYGFFKEYSISDIAHITVKL